MNLPNTVTLGEVIYLIPYHITTTKRKGSDEWKMEFHFDEFLEELQQNDKFILTDGQVEQFSEFCEELKGFIDGIYEKYGGELSGMNGAEDADMICEELKIDDKHPTIVYDKRGNSKLNLYFHQK